MNPPRNEFAYANNVIAQSPRRAKKLRNRRATLALTDGRTDTGCDRGGATRCDFLLATGSLIHIRFLRGKCRERNRGNFLTPRGRIRHSESRPSRNFAFRHPRPAKVYFHLQLPAKHSFTRPGTAEALIAQFELSQPRLREPPPQAYT